MWPATPQGARLDSWMGFCQLRSRSRSRSEFAVPLLLLFPFLSFLSQNFSVVHEKTKIRELIRFIGEPGWVPHHSYLSAAYFVVSLALLHFCRTLAFVSTHFLQCARPLLILHQFTPLSVASFLPTLRPPLLPPTVFMAVVSDIDRAFWVTSKRLGPVYFETIG